MITKLQNLSLLNELRQKVYYVNNILSPKQTNDGLISSKNISSKDRINSVIDGQNVKTSNDVFCNREDINTSILDQWTKEFLNSKKSNFKIDSRIINELSEVDKFKIVIEGKGGETSIGEICNRENITHDTFLDWSRQFLEYRKSKFNNLEELNAVYKKNKILFSKISNLQVFNYLENFVDFNNKNDLILLKSNSIKLDRANKLDTIICLQKINDVRYINKYFEIINSKLSVGGVFVGCLETFSARKNRKSVNKIPIIRDIYFFVEFFCKRILPKLSITKKHYFDLTKGNNRLLSKAEGLGRLVSSGFKIMDYHSIDGLIYFVVKKEKDPVFDLNPSYGPIYKMPRIGKNGKIIKVYKFRTMHPYSEYLQDYVLKVSGYAETGKPAEDFRIPTWGKFMRKYWLDELPQLINVIRGEMKLVGIRPVSNRYFMDIPKEMQKLRLSQKPGCIPPYVSLNRKGNVMSVLLAEKDYLEHKIRNPYFTDTIYFFKAIYNIIFKHKRSA